MIRYILTQYGNEDSSQHIADVIETLNIIEGWEMYTLKFEGFEEVHSEKK